MNPNLQEITELLERFGLLERILRVTAWVRRFISNCRQNLEERKRVELKAEECQIAENLWLKSIQVAMTLESGYIKGNNSLGVFQDEKGHLRCKGRIGKAKIEFDTKFPLLIPANIYYTELVIRSAQEKVYHDGVKETLAEVRSVYWIVKGRQTVKRIIKRCYICKILEGLAYPPPVVTCDLPDFRVTPGKVFETAGVVFCGPVYVKQMYKKNGEMNKEYIAITTCASSRMVHLELTPDLTTTAYLRSRRRFTASRGFT